MTEKTLLWILGGVLLGAAGYLGYTYFQSTKPDPLPAGNAGAPQLVPGYQDYRNTERTIPVGVDAPLTPEEQDALNMWTIPTPEN